MDRIDKFLQARKRPERFTREIVERSQEIPADLLDALGKLAAKVLRQTEMIEGMQRDIKQNTDTIATLQADVDQIRAVMMQVGTEAQKRVQR